ncbi:hypothetical protein RV15_GL001690 [Enterococcus silesiacus]|uniref:Uncharacterized protein n=1 Tax=Enterococcus silesiacus TaxID=332949 RepID=A0AA91GIX7_9ENTE|nr:hypothetical protein RV15_GL001690 [Enterococcus silesiacus]
MESDSKALISKLTIAKLEDYENDSINFYFKDLEITSIT